MPNYLFSSAPKRHKSSDRESVPPRIKNVQTDIVGFEGRFVNLKLRKFQDYNKDVHESFVFTKADVRVTPQD